MSLALLATDSLCDPQIMCVYLRINCRAPHSMYRRRRCGALQSVVSAHTWSCVSEAFTFEEHWSAHNSKIMYGLVNQRYVGACIACGPICGSHDSPQRHFLRRGSQHSFHPIFHSTKWRWSRKLFILFADNISLPNELWLNRCSLELLLILKDLCIIGLINQALILHKNVCKNVLQFCVNTSCG